MKVRNITAIFVAISFFVAPFLWSYIYSYQGVLIRAVDLALMATIVITVLFSRVMLPPAMVTVSFVALILLSLLRGMVWSDAQAIVSALKTTFYFLGAACCMTIISSMPRSEFEKSVKIAFICVLPLCVSLFYVIADAIVSNLGAEVVSSPARFVFKVWNGVFSSNLFGSGDEADVRGVSFRNSAGTAFLVVSLFAYWLKGRPGFVFILFFLFSASFFSRSVWLCQIAFLFFLSIGAKGVGRVFAIFTVLTISIFLVTSDAVSEAVSDRLDSDFGRVEMIDPALDALNDSIWFGREQGAELFNSNKRSVDVHNVPIAYGLKSGFLGLIFALVLTGFFAYQLVARTFRIFSSTSRNSEDAVALVLVLIVFFRPLISASHDVYFSVGEWLALALFLAIHKKGEKSPNVSRKLSQSRSNSADDVVITPV